MATDTPQTIFVNHLTTLAKTLCERPGPQFVPQCNWSDFFTDDASEPLLALTEHGHVVDRCLHGFNALYEHADNLKHKGLEFPFKISAKVCTNGWSRAVVAALQCATVADWPKEPSKRMTAEHIPRLQNEFTALSKICPPHTPIAWHLSCILLVLDLLQTPLNPGNAHETLVKIAGTVIAAGMEHVSDSAKVAAFNAKALEYFLALELGEARFEIASSIDLSKPSVYARQAATSSVFLGATQVSDADKKATKELILEIPRKIYQAIESHRLSQIQTRCNSYDEETLTMLLRKAIEFRAQNAWIHS